MVGVIGLDRPKDDAAAIVFPTFRDDVQAHDGDEPKLITGHVFDDQQIWHLRRLIDVAEAGTVATNNETNEVLGIYLPDTSAEDIDPEASAREAYTLDQYPLFLDHTHVVCTRRENKEEPLESHVRRPTGGDGIENPERLNVEDVAPDRLFVRIETDGRTPLETLREKKVAIIGLGSGGALVATYLAKSGVKEMVFVDDDLFETHNIVRHVCGEEALGRKKVYAVKDYIEKRVPDVNIEPVDTKFDFSTTSYRPNVDAETIKDEFEERFADVDLIVSAAAEQTANYQLDRFVHERDLDIPVIYSGLFSDLRGGIIIRVDPEKNDPSYHCLYSQLEEGGRDAAGRDDTEATRRAEPTSHPAGVTTGRLTPEPTAPEADVPYDRTLEDETSEPGLGLDVDNLSVFVTKTILSNLLEGTDHGLYELDRNIYIWANRDFVMESFDPEKEMLNLYGLELTYPPDDHIPDPSECPDLGD